MNYVFDTKKFTRQLRNLISRHVTAVINGCDGSNDPRRFDKAAVLSSKIEDLVLVGIREAYDVGTGNVKPESKYSHVG